LATTAVSISKNPEAEAGYNRVDSASPKQCPVKSLSLVSALTVLTFLIHGYHPFAEDGGLYLAGVKRVLEPAMYPYQSGFVLGHLRFSIFAPILAFAVRNSGIGLAAMLLIVYVATIWTTLWAGWLLAERCFSGRASIGAVTLLATWFTLPVAGTSLMLMDPYVTARSISTPCTLLALYYALASLTQWRQENQYGLPAVIKACSLLVFAALMHPLMAAYGFCCILALGISTLYRRRTWLLSTLGLCLIAVLVAAVLQTVGPPESLDYRQVAMSRYYWFLSEWHWYEWMGLAGPMVIIGFTAFAKTQKNKNCARVALARMSITAGIAAITVALLFARLNAESLSVARLQPLRIFQTIYIVMVLFVGAQVSVWLGKNAFRWVATFGILAIIMFFAERQTFPSSAHFELPAIHQSNPWVQAFEWIRSNTPKDALFALDSDYITKPGEDAQSFRAIAERSALPDYSKDGGEAAITPSLTREWERGQTLQTRLSERTDDDRIASLRPAGVSWIVVSRNSNTAFPCAYTNAAVKVCHLPVRPPQNSTHPEPFFEARR
jgi:hypothetical protein